MINFFIKNDKDVERCIAELQASLEEDAAAGKTVRKSPRITPEAEDALLAYLYSDYTSEKRISR
jgi:hypothetical protein